MFAEFSSKKILGMVSIVGIMAAGLLLVPLYQRILSPDSLAAYKIHMNLSMQAWQYRFAYADAGSASLANLLQLYSPKNVEGSSALSIPVLLYHGVGNAKASGDAPGAVPLDHFRDQMFALKKAGWQTVSMEDLYAYLKNEREIPDKSFVLTFDDGRKDSYYPVDPVLQALGYRAVNFIITRFSLDETRGYYLNKEELSTMVKSGRWEIESHGRDDHVFYPTGERGEEGLFLANKFWLSDAGRLETEDEFRTRVKGDLIASKSSIESMFSENVLGFAYPYNEYGQGSQNIPSAVHIVPSIVGAVYPMSFYQVWNGNDYAFNHRGKDFSMIKRIEVDQDWTGEHLVSFLENNRERALPYDTSFTNDTGWAINWGQVSAHDDLFEVGATASTTGSTVFLEGSYSWQDYIFRAHVESSQGKSVALIARFHDSHNYVACNYTSGLMHVDQILDGISRTIQGVKLTKSLPHENYDISIRVKGRDVSCYLNDEKIIETPYLDKSLDTGGVGFKTWDPELGMSRMVVGEAHVEKIQE